MDDLPTMGWTLDPEDRAHLLERFPPAFPDVIADHVTLGRQKKKPKDVEASVVGYASDRQGLEALAVAVNGTTARPDGSIYHMTWSLDAKAGRQAIESNHLLEDHGFVELDKPLAIRLYPSVLRG